METIDDLIKQEILELVRAADNVDLVDFAYSIACRNQYTDLVRYIENGSK